MHTVDACQFTNVLTITTPPFLGAILRALWGCWAIFFLGGGVWGHFGGFGEGHFGGLQAILGVLDVLIITIIKCTGVPHI